MVSMASRSEPLATMFAHQAADTCCPAGRGSLKDESGEQGRFVTPMLKHQARRTGFLARRGLEVFVCRFSFGCEVERDERVAGDCVGLRFEAAGLAGRVVLCFTGSCSAGFEARLSAASLAARASLRRRLFR